MVQDRQGQLGITCPSCRQVTPVPEKGTAGLKPAFHINRLLDMKESFQGLEIADQGLEIAEVGAKTSSWDAATCCPEHDGEGLRLHCETCEVLVCYKCVIRGGKHERHEYRDLEKAFPEREREIALSLEQLEKRATNMNTKLQQIVTCYRAMSDQRAAAEEKIHTTFKQLCEVLNIREVELVRQLDEATHSKLKRLANQRDQAETLLAKLNRCIRLARERMKTGNEEDVLLMMKKRINELSVPFEGLEIIAKSDTMFSVLEDILYECQKYGQLSTKGQSMQRSSIPYLILSQVEPWGVAVTKTREIVVTESEKHSVSVFSPSGEKLRSFGTRGSGNGQFIGPRGVTIDDEGNILIADTSNYRVQKFTAEGRFLSTVGTRGTGVLKFSWPTDIAFNPINRRIYVVDNFNNNVQVLNPDLSYSSTFGTTGSAKGQFCSPIGIDCDSIGRVYVADSMNNRTQIFTADGTFLRTLGRYGQGRGQPISVTADNSGMVYVSDCTRHNISVFTPDGNLMTSLGTMGEVPGKFNTPHGLAVGSDGSLYVCDSRNSRVQVFK
jgi:DNA-binding beta-propeller fold protein YncE